MDDVERLGSSDVDRNFAKGIKGFTAIIAESTTGVGKSFEDFVNFQDGVEGAAGVSNCMSVGFAYVGTSKCRRGEEENEG